MDMKYIMRSGLEMYSSLIQSIDEDGGSWEGYNLDEILEMSLMDVMSKLATNNVRFKYVGKEK